MQTIETSLGPWDVEDTGTGPPLLFVHGLLVDATLWDPVVPALAGSYRVVRPNLPLGSHRVPASDRSRLIPEVVADELVTVLDALGIERAVVVASDTGGAIAQLLATRHPDRLAGLVLLSCDAFDHFPPTLLKPLKPMVRFGPVVDLVGWLYRFGLVRRSPLGAGLVLNRPIDPEVVGPWFDRLVEDREVRRDMAAFLRACHPGLTNRAAEELVHFPHPALLAWSKGDPLFPEDDAERLAATIPDCELRWITGAKAFSMIDQPAQVLVAVEPFLDRVASAGGWVAP